MKLAKTSTRNSFVAALTAASLLLAMIGGGSPASAQSTFVGDYDTSFAAPLGYYVDPENPVTPTGDTYQTYFHTGEPLPDGSIIAGGRHVDNAPKGDFYLRKFTASGAVDTSFGTGGYVRTNFHTGFNGLTGSDTPSVLKVQPDGKIVFAGQCTMVEPNSSSQAFGVDACVMRYNANGTLDQTFGGGTLTYNWPGTTHNVQLEPGKVIFQTGVVNSGQTFGTSGIYYDMAIQPDGKIVLVGETRNWASLHVAQGYGAIVVRLNANGSLDTTFGSNGIARWTATEIPQGCGGYAPRSFYGVRPQPDGRIIAVGYDEITRGDCFNGTRFVVTRWTAAGQLETVRYIGALANVDVFFTERAVHAHLTRDGSKILVSGSSRNLSGTPAGRQKPTMVRLNLSDLSLDTSFGNGGIVQYDRVSDSWVFSTLYVKAIQPDGKIIGTDNASGATVVRFNPDGSSDQSFGNMGLNDFSPGGRGRLRVVVLNYNGVSSQLEAGQVLVRPNGRINLIGHSAAHSGLGILRAAVSQNTSTGAQNPIDDPQTYTFVHYYDFLNREADAPGLAFWAGEITSCGSDAACVARKRVQVSAAFFLSIEFQETGFLVYRLYKAAFGDLPGKPVPVRREEFLPDTLEIGEGVRVGIDDWQQRLEQNKQDFVAAFVARPRFTAAYPSTMTAAEFVDKLNQNAGGALDAAERSQLITELGQAPGDAQKRASVLRQVAEDQTLKDAELRKAFVLMQYFGYLQRNPDDPPDGNFDGFLHWLQKLEEHNGNYVRAEMVRSFVESIEYRSRFGQP